MSFKKNPKQAAEGGKVGGKKSRRGIWQPFDGHRQEDIVKFVKDLVETGSNVEQELIPFKKVMSLPSMRRAKIPRVRYLRAKEVNANLIRTTEQLYNEMYKDYQIWKNLKGEDAMYFFRRFKTYAWLLKEPELGIKLVQLDEKALEEFMEKDRD